MGCEDEEEVNERREYEAARAAMTAVEHRVAEQEARMRAEQTARMAVEQAAWMASGE